MPVLDRRQFVTRSALSLAAGALARVPLLAQPEPFPATRFQEIRRGVGIFIGPGGTIGWLATPDGVLVVDTQFPGTAAVCLEGLRQRSRAGIHALINTHHHADHTAGNATFRPNVRQIVQHERCAALHRRALQDAGSGPPQGVADTTFADHWSIAVGDETISTAYFGPAHTSGDAAVVFERANVVHLGDLVFNRIPPFVDRPAGASIQHWIGVLERVASRYRGATFIFGHGKGDAVTGGVADVLLFRDYLTAVLDYVRAGIAAGRPEAEIVALDVLPGFPEHVNLVKNYSSAFPLFTLSHVLTAAYEELTAP